MLALARLAMASTRAPPRPLRQNSNVAARKIDSLVSPESRGRLPRLALPAGCRCCRLSHGRNLAQVSGATRTARTSLGCRGFGEIEIAIAVARQGDPSGAFFSPHQFAAVMIAPLRATSRPFL